MNENRMRKKADHRRIVTLLAAACAAVLVGCSSENKVNEIEKQEPVIEIKTPEKTEPSIKPEKDEKPEKTPEPEEKTGREDGERFEDTIMLEGMEETVKYEHVKDTAKGFEMDYDYESLTRLKEADREKFVSV